VPLLTTFKNEREIEKKQNLWPENYFQPFLPIIAKKNDKKCQLTLALFNAF